MTTTDFLATLPTALDLTTRGVETKNVTDAIKRDVKRAIVAGLLPRGCKISVRKRPGSYYSTRCGSIAVRITAWPGAVFTDAAVERFLECANPHGEHALADEFRAAVKLIEQIAGRHNYSRSRIEEDYFDVGYYLHVDGRDAEHAARVGLKQEAELVRARRAA